MVHLLTFFVALETLPKVSAMSLFPSVPSLVAEHQDLVVGQGLTPSEAVNSFALFIQALGMWGKGKGHAWGRDRHTAVVLKTRGRKGVQ